MASINPKAWHQINTSLRSAVEAIEAPGTSLVAPPLTIPPRGAHLQVLTWGPDPTPEQLAQTRAALDVVLGHVDDIRQGAASVAAGTKPGATEVHAALADIDLSTRLAGDVLRGAREISTHPVNDDVISAQSSSVTTALGHLAHVTFPLDRIKP